MFKNKLIKNSLYGLLFSLIIIFGGLIGEVKAATVTPATNGAGISIDTSSKATTPSWTTLGDIVITESEAGEISKGLYSISVRAGSDWEILESLEGLAVTGSNGIITTLGFSGEGSNAFQFTVTDASTSPAVLTISGLKVRPISESSDINAGLYFDITGQEINNIDRYSEGKGVMLAELSAIPGAATELVFNTQPASTDYGSSINSVTVQAKDQFANISISNPITMSINSGDGLLSGTLEKSATTESPDYVFDDLSINKAGTFTLKASSGSINATSNPFDISAKQLTISDPTLTTTKTYDATVAAEVTPGALSGLVGGDEVTVSAVASYDGKNIGEAKTITVTYALGGTNKDNYIKPIDHTATGVITKRVITVTAQGGDKVYDGNNSSSLEPSITSGTLAAPEAATYKQTYNDKIVGTKTLTPEITITNGSDNVNTNYDITLVTTEGNISFKDLNVINANLSNKIYDGTTDADITGAELGGVLGSDSVNLVNGNVGTFNSKNIGSGIAVTTNMTLSGDDYVNYKLTEPTDLKGNITAKELVVTGATVTTKVYDGNTNATIVGASLDGVVDTEDVILENYTTGTFNSKNIGSGIAVTTNMTLSGDDYVNYKLTEPTDLKGGITAKGLTVTGATVTTKTYDGNTNATITGASLVGVVDTEGVILENYTTGTFDTKDVGTDKTVTTSMTITGTDVGNYTLIQPSLTGTIKAVSGGGGSVGPSISFCSAVVYSPWGSCVSGYQNREVISKTSGSCTLTTEQQLATRRQCITSEQKDVDEDGSDVSSSTDVNVKSVMEKERNLVKNINKALASRLSGRILLQVEEGGQAWYVDTSSNYRHFMGRPHDAFSLMRNFGLGISEANFNKFSKDKVPAKFAGQIFLRVEKSGEAYYVNPVDLKMHYLGRPADAFQIMRNLALGINNVNIRQIGVGK